MNRIQIALVTGLLVGAFAARVHAQACDGKTEQRLDQENYLALTDRVYVYAPDISSAGGGWRSFNLRILSGTYRKPMLLAKAYMKESDLQSVLSSRRDLRQSTLTVPAFDPRRSSKPAFGAPATVPNGERPGTITVRVTRVVPVSKGVDHLFLVCSAGR